MILVIIFSPYSGLRLCIYPSWHTCWLTLLSALAF